VSISSVLGRIRRRLALAYQVGCARDDRARYGVQVPTGVWFCDHCSVLLWDQPAFARHKAAHAGAFG